MWSHPFPTGGRERDPAPGAQRGFEPGSPGQSLEPCVPRLDPSFIPRPRLMTSSHFSSAEDAFQSSCSDAGGAVLALGFWDVRGAGDWNHTAEHTGTCLPPLKWRPTRRDSQESSDGAQSPLTHQRRSELPRKRLCGRCAWLLVVVLGASGLTCFAMEISQNNDL